MLKDLCVLPSSGNSVLKKKREKKWGKPLGSYIGHNIRALLKTGGIHKHILYILTQIHEEMDILQFFRMKKVHSCYLSYFLYYQSKPLKCPPTHDDHRWVGV